MDLVSKTDLESKTYVRKLIHFGEGLDTHWLHVVALHYSQVPRRIRTRVVLLRNKTISINGIPDSADLTRQIFTGLTLPL